VVSSIGVFYFYKLIREIFNERVAFSAAFILSTSIWFGFARKIMPDTFSVALMIISLYYAWDYLTNGRRFSLVLFFVLSSLAMLCKIPALSLFSALGIVFFIREIPVKRKVYMYITGTLSFLIAGLWYFYWVPHLLQSYDYQLYFPKGIVEGIQEIIPLLPEALEKFYFSSLMSFIAFACFLAGLVLILRSKNQLFKITLALVFLVFVVFIIKTGAVFPLHSYYVIPFVPLMALVAGYFISKIPLRFQYILLGLIAIEAIANQQHDFFIKDSEKYKLGLEQVAEKTIPKGDLIIINGGASPQQIYLSHRKGWTVESEKLQSTTYIDSLSTLGAKYLILDTKKFGGEIKTYPKIYTDDHFAVYDLR
jgi:4-amino-4-deoxy-L-arabinose transferase-like glycosyltransferase